MTLRSGQAHGSIRTWRRHFPLNSIDDVVELFRDILLTNGFQPLEPSERLKALRCQESLKGNLSHSSTTEEHSNNILASYKQEPDLVFVSILLGSIEHQLTEPDGQTSLRLKTRPQSLTFSPRHVHDFSTKHKLPSSPLSIHIELPEEETFSSNNCEQSTPDLLSHSPEGSETKSQCGSTSASRSRTSTRRRRGADRVRRRHVSSTSSDHNLPQNLEPSVMYEKRRFSDTTAPASFPCVTFEETEQRYQDFYNLIITSPKLLPFIVSPSGPKSQEARSNVTSTKQWATRQLICSVCEVLWSRMTVNKSRERLAHSQSIHSLLSAGILDSFGLAYTTVAACRLLGYLDVDLALSEDHGWVEFGPPDARQTADVASWVPGAHLLPARDTDAPDRTVESKADSEKLDDTNNPPPIRVPPLVQSWLYVNGHPVICRPSMRAVAAAVAALQPGSSLPAGLQAPFSAPPDGSFASSPSTPYLHGSNDLISPNGLARHLSTSSAMSMQLITLKHRLLWLFFDAGCLSRYPLGLTNLGDLEDAFPCMDNLKLLPNTTQSPKLISTVDRIPEPVEPVSMALTLYYRAVEVDRCFYANQHVYPYTCLASCLYRHGDNRGALRYWSEAARVMGHYNHSSEDWEIYRELLEVATQLMPHMFRYAAEASRSCSEGAVDTDPDGCLYQPENILDDPQCLAYLLAFYDNLCLWEEGSPVPVLHVGWVDKLMVNLTRFSQRARRLLRLSADLSRFDGHTPECVPEISEPISCPEIGPPSKRVRRHSRSVVVGRDELHHHHHQQPVQSSTGATLPIPTDSLDLKNVLKFSCPVSTKQKPENLENLDTAVDGTASPAAQSLSKSGSRTPLSAITPLVESLTVNPNASIGRQRSSKKKSSKAKSRNKSKESLKLPDCQLSLNNADSKPSSVLVDFDNNPATDQNSDPQQLLLPDSSSPESLATTDLLSHDDLLTSLAEACDQRLLNPAFLWGLERDVPFLPANVAPEEAFTKLLSALEPDSSSLFPTPPNSGGLYEPVTDKLTEDNIARPNLIGKSLSDVEEFPNADFVLSTECAEGQASEHSSDIPLFPDCLDSMEGTENMVTLDELSDEFLQSVNDLVQSARSTGFASSDACEPSSPVLESAVSEQCSASVESRIRPKRPRTMEELMVDLVLSSIKMVSIIELLRAPRLNSSAIKLALTAQSQVCLRRTGLCPANGV